MLMQHTVVRTMYSSRNESWRPTCALKVGFWVWKQSRGLRSPYRNPNPSLTLSTPPSSIPYFILFVVVFFAFGPTSDVWGTASPKVV